jgi:hypothetical protein
MKMQERNQGERLPAARLPQSRAAGVSSATGVQRPLASSGRARSGGELRGAVSSASPSKSTSTHAISAFCMTAASDAPPQRVEHDAARPAAHEEAPKSYARAASPSRRPTSRAPPPGEPPTRPPAVRGRSASRRVSGAFCGGGATLGRARGEAVHLRVHLRVHLLVQLQTPEHATALRSGPGGNRIHQLDHPDELTACAELPARRPGAPTRVHGQVHEREHASTAAVEVAPDLLAASRVVLGDIVRGRIAVGERFGARGGSAQGSAQRSAHAIFRCAQLQVSLRELEPL